jgi:hypothetical protein
MREIWGAKETKKWSGGCVLGFNGAEAKKKTDDENGCWTAKVSYSGHPHTFTVPFSTPPHHQCDDQGATRDTTTSPLHPQHSKMTIHGKDISNGPLS